jgi:hypothetical protein
MEPRRPWVWNPQLAREPVSPRLDRQGALPPILHDHQAAFGCAPEEAIAAAAVALLETEASGG